MTQQPELPADAAAKIAALRGHLQEAAGIVGELSTLPLPIDQKCQAIALMLDLGKLRDLAHDLNGPYRITGLKRGRPPGRTASGRSSTVGSRR